MNHVLDWNGGKQLQVTKNSVKKNREFLKQNGQNTNMMKRGEKQKLIDQSLVACHLNAEAPRDRGEVRLYELSKAPFFKNLFALQ